MKVKWLLRAYIAKWILLLGFRMWRNKSKKVIIFNPESLILPHFSSMQKLGVKLTNAGYQVKWVTCNGGILRCPCHDMRQVRWDQHDPNKSRACFECKWNAITSNLIAITDSILIDRFLSNSLKDEINILFQNATSFSPRKFIYKKMKFGEIAAAATIMLLKKEPKWSEDNEVLKYWKTTCIAAICVYEACLKIFRVYKPDILIHFDQYPILMAARKAAMQSGVRVFTVCNPLIEGIDRTKIQFFNFTYNKFIRTCATYFKKHKPNFSYAGQKIMLDDLLRRMQGGLTHVFSPKVSKTNFCMRGNMQIKQNKVILAFTSSEDEVDVERSISEFLDLQEKPRKCAFKTQKEWLYFLRDECKANKWHLIIRVHPREAGTERNPRKNDDLRYVYDVFPSSNKYVTLIPPESNISSYNLFQVADLITVSYSSICLEAARCGIPVISGFSNPGYEYPNLSLLMNAQTKMEYIRKIKHVLSRNRQKDINSSLNEIYNFCAFINPINSYEIESLQPLLDITEINKRNIKLFTIKHSDKKIKENISKIKKHILKNFFESSSTSTSLSPMAQNLRK